MTQIKEAPKRSIIDISKDIERIYDLVEQYADPETGELELPGEVEKALEVSLAELKDKADNIALAQVIKEKQIEALKTMKNSIQAKQKAIENSLERVKKFLAPITRRYGEPTGKNNTATLSGKVVKIKDNSKYDFLLDCEEPRSKRSLDANDYPIKYRTASITIPLKEYQRLLDNGFDDSLIISADVTGINKDKLKEDYQKEFDKLNGIKEGMSETALALTRPKDKIKYPDIKGIKKVWKDRVTITGLKKLEVQDAKH